MNAPAAGEAALEGPRRGGLDGLFNPHSIAVIGASADPLKVSGRPLQYLKSRGFPGPVYPINPQRDEVQGLKAYPSLAAVSGPVDQALIGLPAASVPDAVEACIAKRVRSIVLFSGGFGEAGPAGLAAQQQITRRCVEARVRLLGPNCLGMVSFSSGTYATISQSLEMSTPNVGPIAIVTQSGAVGTYALVKGAARGIGFSRFVATGNEADVDVADCIGWLATDPETRVIAAYLESCKDGRRLASALELARLHGKPVVLLKGGASEIGSSAAVSHTGALAGSDQVYDAVLRATGVARARSIDELLDVALAASLSPMPAGRRLGVITISGGFGIMLADAAARVGLSLPSLPPETQARIKAFISLATPANPVDMTMQVQGNLSLLQPLLASMLDGGHFDALVAFLGTMTLDPRMLAPLRELLSEARRRHPDVLLALCAMADDKTRATFGAEKIIVLEDPERMVAAISHLAGFGEAQRRTRPATLALPPAAAPLVLKSPINEVDAKRMLAAAGIPFAQEVLAHSAEEAGALAKRFAVPVALKVVSGDIAHKSEIGGVMLGLAGRDDASSAYSAIIDRVQAERPEARIAGVSVAPMVKGVETVMGVTSDPDFGPVVMFGLGGIYVEVLKDVTFRIAPFDEEEAMAMIREIRSFAVLAGVRGQPGVDLGALARTLAALSSFAAGHREEIESVDINPFIALAEGGVAVDALIVPRTEAHELHKVV